MLYRFATTHAAGFSDVKTGDNKCTRGNGVGDPARGGAACCKLGFEAASGWDPVVGLGTPKFEALKSYVLDLP